MSFRFWFYNKILGNAVRFMAVLTYRRLPRVSYLFARASLWTLDQAIASIKERTEP